MKYLKNNKIFMFMFVFSIISFILGIFFYYLIGDNNKELITSNINLLFNNKLVNYSDLFLNNILITSIIYILGISVIGIIIILPIYLFKVFILSFEFTSLIINLKFHNIFVILLYLIPNIINIIIYYIICYYAVSYSIFLIKNIYFNKSYNMFKISKKYLFIYLISLAFIILSSFLEIFILPRLKLFII